MIDARRQDRPRHARRHGMDAPAGFRRTGERHLKKLGAAIEREAHAALDQFRHHRGVGGLVLALQRVGEEFDDEEHVLAREIFDAMPEDLEVVLVRLRTVGAEIHHDLARRAAELAHLARADALGEARQAMAGRIGIVAGSVEPDEERHVARQRPILDHAGHRADRIEEHRRGMRAEILHDVRLHLAEVGIGDRLLCFRIGGEQRAHAAALVAGDRHHGTVGRAYLLEAAQLRGCELAHVVLLSIRRSWCGPPRSARSGR